MMTLATELVRIAEHELGRHEVGGNNVGPDIVKYQQATWLPPGPWAWCAAFVDWCLLQALVTPEGAAYMSGRLDSRVEHFRCRDASAFGMLEWARHAQLDVYTAAERQYQAGDIIVFDFNGALDGGGHCGIVSRDALATSSSFETIEGNTNIAGARESHEGDGVLRKTRTPKLVRGIIRL